MNNHKFCFIICYNDDLFLSECTAYINTLTIPEGYSVDICAVKDAPSMCEGYQYAMTHSDAKYKIYLHQDVFIINVNFLIDLLDTFNSDPKIGMIGLVGIEHMPASGVMWDDNHHRCGLIRSNFIYYEGASNLLESTSSITEVEAIDGLLMATCQDIPWREDLFNGWDFYDISQSAEFRKAGYKIVVPPMDSPWVIHDNAIANLTNYSYWKEVYLKEYS